MKKISLCLMTAGLLLTFQPVQSYAKTVIPSTLVTSEPIDAAQAKILLQRLNEIKEMDKSNLKSSEKKNLRTEVRLIKHRLSVAGGGVYISVGALILIILLLVILF